MILLALLWLVAAFCLVAGLVFWPALLWVGGLCLAGLLLLVAVYAWGLVTGKWDQGPVTLP